MPVVDLGERRAFYERGGDGEPLLLIMGMSGHHGMWGEPFRSLLERDFDVLAYDHRGIGESGWAEAPFTIAELAEDTVRLMAAVGWRSAHVLGISMGGMVAQELALTHPELVRTLVLGCTYAGPNGGSLHAPGPLRLVEAISTRDAELALRTAFEVNLSQQYRAAAGDYEAFRQLGLSAKVPAAVVMMQAQAAFGHDTVARLPDLRIPTLVVHGTADEMVAASNGEHIAGLVPDAKLQLLDGVGHLFWLEQPRRSAELVREHALGR